MRKIFLLCPCAFVAILTALVGFASEDLHTKHHYTGQGYRVEYQKLNGLFDGAYTSWYTNGKMKAQGHFKDNMRIGKWTVWDSTGQMKIQREYKNSFEFTRTFPAYNEGPATLFSAPRYKLEKDEYGCTNYFKLEERAVAYNKRLWRFIPRKENSPLFENDRLYRLMIDMTLNGNYAVYEDDEFRVKRTLPVIAATDKKETNDSLLGFMIKEDCFFDTDRMLSETRIIGICPLVLSGNDTMQVGWYYYPQIRSMLGKEKITAKNLPAHILSLDDVLFFRYFDYFTYKEENYWDRQRKKSIDLLIIGEDQRHMDARLLEVEHDFWIWFGPER